MKIKFAIIGCGSIGKRHMAVLDANADTEVVGLCDLDEAKVKALSDLYGGIPYFTDVETLLNEAKPDVVSIATPHKLHAPQAITCLNAGKHVLVEKPMALSSAEALEMIAAAEKNNKKLWVVKQNRFNVPVAITNEAIKTNKLGKIYLVKCDVLWNRNKEYYVNSAWRGQKEEEGGALFTQVSHFIDLLYWWLGDIDKASSFTSTMLHDIDIEDNGVANLKFESGTLASITWTTCVFNKNYEGSILIVGEKGTIKIGGTYLNKIEFWDVENHPLDENIEFNDLPNNYGKYQGTSSNHDKVIASLVQEIRFGNVKNVEGYEGIKSVELIERIYNTTV